MNNIVVRIFHLIKVLLFYKPLFGRISYRSVVVSPLSIDGKNNIYLGNAYIGYKTWLAAVPISKGNTCSLIIGDGCKIGHFNHIYSTGNIIIENDVLTADKVYISDNLHAYLDVDTPIHRQKIVQKNKVVIGEGSWLGENVCVIGASVGKHCVIGANSVVTKDIPDYCVAVGAPARVIKYYDTKSKQWVKKNENI